MKTRPILFSGPMVRALLDGRKTQTRRIVKPQPPSIEAVKAKCGAGFSIFSDHHFPPDQFRVGGDVWAVRELMGIEPQWRCPYGRVGHRLWVRETWAPHADEEQTCRNYHAAQSGDGGLSEPGVVRPEIFYCADGGDPFINNWRPSIHMPRWASRITLEVTGVRVERVQDISEEDAKAEGAEPYLPESEPKRHRLGFESLWCEGLRRDAARLHAQMRAALVRYYAAQMVRTLREQKEVAP